MEILLETSHFSLETIRLLLLHSVVNASNARNLIIDLGTFCSKIFRLDPGNNLQNILYEYLLYQVCNYETGTYPWMPLTTDVEEAHVWSCAFFQLGHPIAISDLNFNRHRNAKLLFQIMKISQRCRVKISYSFFGWNARWTLLWNIVLISVCLLHSKSVENFVFILWPE